MCEALVSSRLKALLLSNRHEVGFPQLYPWVSKSLSSIYLRIYQNERNFTWVANDLLMVSSMRERWHSHTNKRFPNQSSRGMQVKIRVSSCCDTCSGGTNVSQLIMFDALAWSSGWWYRRNSLKSSYIMLWYHQWHAFLFLTLWLSP